MIKRFIFITAVLFSFSLLSAQVVSIDLANEKQVIDGFGASTAWHGKITQAEADAAFKNEDSTQMGLSILRVRISPNSNDWSGWADEKANAQKAKAEGALILASPWSPPAALKTINSTTGGELKPESYADYATHLNKFCDYLGNVDVVSLQNEPNIKVDYESCDWTPEQILEFSRNNAATIGVPLMIPEAYNFDKKYSDPVLNDSLANSNVSYIGGHIYGSRAYNYQNAIDKGKTVWMTEHFYNGDTIEECLNMAKEIAECMYSNMNAYVWWWLRQPGCNLMESGGKLKKKGYTMGQFSKFIRPGFVRVDATFQPSNGIFVVAFKGPDRNVVVAVNQNNVSRRQTIVFRNEMVESVNKYVTSSTKNIQNEGAIETSRNGIVDNLEPQSITTYVSEKKSTYSNPIKSTEIKLFPNPASEYIRFSTLENVNSIQIYNSLGQSIISVKNPGNTIFDISDLKSGMYVVLLKKNRGEQRMKFLKK